jgi:hypothetical protein
MSSDFTLVLRSRINELQARQGLLQASLARLQDEISKVERRIHVYKAALVLEEGDPSFSHDEQQTLVEQAITNIPEAKTDSSEKSKIFQIRRFIASECTEGFEARDIARYVRNSGISPHGAFAYNVIKRLKDYGELITDGNRYFPTGKLLEALGQSKMSFETSSDGLIQN